MKQPKVIKRFYIKGIKFDGGLEEYVSIKKHQKDFSLEKHLQQTKNLEIPNYSSSENEIKKAWENTKPITPLQALKKFHNSPHKLMVVLSILDPSATLKILNSKIKDKQTIPKTQIKTTLKNDSSVEFKIVKKQKNPQLFSQFFESEEVTYEDTYILHEIDHKQFGDNSDLINPIFILEVKCPSTNNHYFLFVDSTEPQCQDAIGAVAWTMIKDDGTCLTKEEYLKLQSES